MEWEFIAPMIISTVFILTVGGVILLRPAMKRLGALLDVLASRRPRAPDDENAASATRSRRMNERLTLMEERLDFTERLIGGVAPLLLTRPNLTKQPPTTEVRNQVTNAIPSTSAAHNTSAAQAPTAPPNQTARF